MAPGTWWWTLWGLLWCCAASFQGPPRSGPGPAHVRLASGHVLGPTTPHLFRAPDAPHDRGPLRPAPPPKSPRRRAVPLGTGPERVPVLIHVRRPPRGPWAAHARPACGNLASLSPVTARSYALLDSPGCVRRLLALPFVSWAGALLPDFKISRTLQREAAAPGPRRRARALRVHLFPGSAAADVLDGWRQEVGARGWHVAFAVRPHSPQPPEGAPPAAVVTAVCGPPHAAGPGPAAGNGTCPAALAPLLARDARVLWVEPGGAHRLLNRHARAVLEGGGADPPWGPYAAAGLDGAGQIASSADSGIDLDHCFFHDPAHATPGAATNTAHRKVVRYDAHAGPEGAPDAAEGHGTHTVGSLCGDPLDPAEPAGADRGAAPAAKVAFHDCAAGDGGLEVPEPVDSALYEPHYALGARVHSHSWGMEELAYNTDCRETDRFAHAHAAFVGVFALGNSAHDYCRGPAAGPCDKFTVNAPASAKNVLGVGASMQPAISWVEQGRVEDVFLRYNATSACRCSGEANANVWPGFGAYCAPWDSDCGAAGWCYVAPGACGDAVQSGNSALHWSCAACAHSDVVRFWPAEFGAPLYRPAAARLVAAAPADACAPLTNAAAMRGRAVLVDRGTCRFVEKAARVEAAGGRAMLVANNVGGAGFTMAGTPAAPLGIACVMVARDAGDRLRGALRADPHLHVTLPVDRRTGDPTDFPHTRHHLSGWSSRGPTGDYRYKPDVVAPGEYVRSAASDGALGGRTCGLTSSLGTSMSTPLVAGAALLVRQYFAEGWHGAGVRGSAAPRDPSGALVRAVLINSAEPLTGTVDRTGAGDRVALGPVPSYEQGHGLVQLSSVLPVPGVAAAGLFVRDGAALATGERHEYCVRFAPGNGTGVFKATLVWADPPAALLSRRALVNDLDLQVRAPAGGVHFGNARATDAPPRRDAANPVEKVRVPAQAAGVFSVAVLGVDVPQGPQAYALTATGTAAAGPCAPVCGGSCGGHGACGAAGLCRCDADWYGADCSWEVAVLDGDAAVEVVVPLYLWRYFRLRVAGLLRRIRVEMTVHDPLSDPDYFVRVARLPDQDTFDGANTECDNCGVPVDRTLTLASEAGVAEPIYIGISNGCCGDARLTLSVQTVTVPHPAAPPTLMSSVTQTGSPSPTCTPYLNDLGADTATVTPTFAATTTGTMTATEVHTGTTTVTPTLPPTCTSTGTPTFTPTFPPTCTSTGTPTFTPTFPPTCTSTGTPTFTPTFPPTCTSTGSSAMTATAVHTGTTTVTPTFLTTHTGTGTPTFTPTFPPTSTSTFTPTFTSTCTSTGSSATTATAVRTGTTTVTPIFTSTCTSTGSSATTATAVRTGTTTATPTLPPTCTSTGTPTFTPTFPPTSTCTFTPTFTSTCTSTGSSAMTATAVHTGTTTVTPTLPPTCTSTGTPTFTPTFPPTSTCTFTPTFTSTCTSTGSSAMTATAVHTGTTTVTPTLPPTCTSTGTPTFTPTFPPTSTCTFTPTFTSTCTSTGSSAMTATAVHTGTTTATPTLPPTCTSTGTPTFTPTFPPTCTSTGSSAMTATAVHTGTTTVTPTFPTTHTGTGTPTFTPTFPPTCTSTGSSAMTATAVHTGTTTVTPTLPPTCTSTGTPTFTPTFPPTCTSTGSIALTATAVRTGTTTATPTFTVSTVRTGTPSLTARAVHMGTATPTPGLPRTVTGTLTPAVTAPGTGPPTATSKATALCTGTPVSPWLPTVTRTCSFTVTCPSPLSSFAVSPGPSPCGIPHVGPLYSPGAGPVPGRHPHATVSRSPSFSPSLSLPPSPRPRLSTNPLPTFIPIPSLSPSPSSNFKPPADHSPSPSPNPDPTCSPRLHAGPNPGPSPSPALNLHHSPRWSPEPKNTTTSAKAFGAGVAPAAAEAAGVWSVLIAAGVAITVLGSGAVGLWCCWRSKTRVRQQSFSNVVQPKPKADPGLHAKLQTAPQVQDRAVPGAGCAKV